MLGERTIGALHGWVSLLLLGPPLLLVGCAVGPDFKTPDVNVPESWQTTDDAHIARTATDALWWKAFDDPALDRLVELAYGQNLPLQIAGLRIMEARAQLAIATGEQYPQVQQAFASALAAGLSKNAPIAAGIPRYLGDYRIGFDAAWELDFWGKYRRGVQAAAASMLSSVADYYAALVSLTAEVARTYVVIRTFEVLIDLIQENVRLQEDGLKIAESRFHNGATSELDPTQATTLLEGTRASIPPLQTSLQQARNALSTLLGQPTGTVEALITGPAAIPRAPATVAVGLPAEMLRRRPDIRRAELNAAAQCARIGVAKADLYPSFSLAGTIGLETATTAAGTPNLFSLNGIFFNAGPRISWPFFNYGRLTNAVRVQDARFEELLVAYHDTVLRAAQEVQDALTGFVNARQAVVFSQNAVKSAERSEELALAEYREGATGYERVLDAQRALLEQQNNLAQSSSSVATDLIALYKALGGGWEVRQRQPFIPEGTVREMKERTNWGDMLSQPPASDPAKGQPPAKP